MEFVASQEFPMPTVRQQDVTTHHSTGYCIPPYREAAAAAAAANLAKKPRCKSGSKSRMALRTTCFLGGAVWSTLESLSRFSEWPSAASSERRFCPPPSLAVSLSLSPSVSVLFCSPGRRGSAKSPEPIGSPLCEGCGGDVKRQRILSDSLRIFV